MPANLNLTITRAIELVKNDNTSGAQALTVKSGHLLSDIIRAVPQDMPLTDAHELIVKTCRQIVRSQPSMAPLKQMMKQFILQIEDVTHFPDFKKRALSFIDKHLEQLREIKYRIASHAVPLLANKKIILTHSLSTLVFETLREAARARMNFEVYATEARPVLEGRLLAQQLSEFGVPVTLIVDAAAPGYVEKAEIVFLGADRITRSDIINKIGSLAIVLAAHAAQKPCYILAGSDKFLPEEEEPVTLSDGLEREVWEDAPVGIKVVNPYFERIPVRLVTAVISETGIIPYGQFAEQGGLR